MHLASSLPYMIIEHLLICPCNSLINNQYWDVFGDLVMCSKPKKCKNMLKF